MYPSVWSGDGAWRWHVLKFDSWGVGTTISKTETTGDNAGLRRPIPGRGVAGARRLVSLSYRCRGVENRIEQIFGNQPRLIRVKRGGWFRTLPA